MLDSVFLQELIIETVQGLWWQPTAGSMRASQPGALAASLADAEGGAELLRLAAAQRMSTESRRAVFCVVMGSQDAVDASERLIRLPLKVLRWSDGMRLLRLPLKVLHCPDGMPSSSAVGRS